MHIRKCTYFRAVILTTFVVASTARYSPNLDERGNDAKTTIAADYYTDESSTPPPSVGDLCNSESCGPGEVCVDVDNSTEPLTASEEVDEQLKQKSGIMVQYVGTSVEEDYDNEALAVLVGVCACDSAHDYNQSLHRCVARNLTDGTMREIHHTELDIRNEIKFAFLGVSVSIILFVTIVVIGTLTACAYCCRINWSDRKMRKELQALRKTIKKDPKKKAVGVKPDAVPGPSREEARRKFLSESEYVPAVVFI